MSKISILDFLPQSKDTLMVDPSASLRNLKLMRVILAQGIEALNCFLKGEYYKFDAQVGETLCQIRAYKIYLLSSKVNPNKARLENFLVDLNKAHLSICEKTMGYEQNKKRKLYNKNLTLHCLFADNELHFQIPEDFYYLICCYVLCKYSSANTDGIPVGIDQYKLMLDFNISRHLAKRIINNFQKKISILSCDFIFDISSELYDDYQGLALHQLKQTGDEGRIVLPCYQVTDIILQHLLKNHGGFFLIVSHTNHYLKDTLLFNTPNKEIVLIDPIPDNVYSEAYVFFKGKTSNRSIKSKSSLIDKFLTHGVDKIILANAAEHPQYSGKALCNLRVNPFSDLITLNGDGKMLEVLNHLKDKLIYFQKYSRRHGCGEMDKNLFFINHIVCDTVTHQVDIIEKQHKTKDRLGRLEATTN